MSIKHSYFSDVEPNRNETFMDWVSSGLLINTDDKISDTPVLCFLDHEDFILSLVETDPELPVCLMLISYELFDEFVNCERTAWLLPPATSYDDGDLVYFLVINENGYPTGHWFLASLDFQDYFGSHTPGLKKGYELVVLDIHNSSSSTVG